MKKKKYAKSLGFNRTTNSKKPIRGPRFQAMIVWETPREDSGDKYITATNYKDFMDNLLWIFNGNDGQIQLATNPKIIMAKDNGYDVLWKIQDNVERLLKQEIKE